MATMDQAPAAYPVRVDVPYPELLSRWLPFVKWLLAIPHYIILYFLRILAGALTIIALFSILFTKRYPRELFAYVVGVRRWQLNTTTYTDLMRDEYPPFSWDAGLYPASLEVDYPEEMNRWLPLVKWILAIPHYVVLVLLAVAVFVTTIIAFFAILFTRRYPRSLFDFAVGVLRWGERVELYVTLMTDAYPPFRLGP
jgi:roadblock/LC7 domain-containing protein